MEIIRKNELQEILDLVKMMSHGKFLITGAAGSGKTFLLNIAGKILWEQGKKIRYKNMELFPDDKETGDYLSESSDTVYLIDGLDDIYRYKQIVKEIEFGKACYICTSRENQFATKFDYEIKLEPLTTEQTFFSINDYLGNHASNGTFIFRDENRNRSNIEEERLYNRRREQHLLCCRNVSSCNVRLCRTYPE